MTLKKLLSLLLALTMALALAAPAAADGALWYAEAQAYVTEAGQMAGPVCFRRYTGTFDGQEIRIEVWEIPDPETGEIRLITELSLKTTENEAAGLREALTGRLAQQGLLLTEDTLKTRMILDAYFGD